MNGPEHIAAGKEVTSAIAETAAARAETLRRHEASAERSPDRSSEHQVAEARKETEGVFAQEASKEQRSRSTAATPAAIRTITAREKRRVYKQTLTRVQAEMSTPARTFSKIIHAPVIEKASETVGNTVARPNALLVGGMVAFAGISIMYVLGRMYGYHLSGFEMIGAYVLGWVIGMLADYFHVMATGKSLS